MIVSFFSAGHHNYARNGFNPMNYARSIEAMPDKLQEQYLKGQLAMDNKLGIFNGILSDMAIESIYIRYGHGQRGIIHLTMKPEAFNT
jgi:hypothetical protein